MKLRSVLMFAFIVVMATLIAAPGVEAKSTKAERRISLSATTAGKTIRAKGHARTRVRGERQSLTVEVEARVAAGTQFTVYVTNGGTEVLAGTVTIARGEGEIELKNYDGKTLPAGVAPVGSITAVTVKDANGTVVLTGTF